MLVHRVLLVEDIVAREKKKSWKGAKDVAENFHFKNINDYGLDWII